MIAAGSDWSYGGSILTFVFPMILFLGVAAVLYMLYTKPQTVPGERGGQARARSVAATLDAASPRQSGPVTAGQTAAGGAGQGSPSAARAGSADGGETAATPAGQAGPAGGGQVATAGQADPAGSAEGKE